MQLVNPGVLNRKIRVGAVNYLNTKPLIYGFRNGEIKEAVDLITDFPAQIAAMLLNDEIDVGLVPVSIIPQLKVHYIISEFCIGCDGEVGSVCLFSEVPLEKIEHILLDSQSRTSVNLLKVLIKQYWKINPALISTGADFRSRINGTTGAIMIGDKALEQRKKSKYKYDLGSEWKKFTGLPFVFAAWISNKKLNSDFIETFNNANQLGLQHLSEVIAENPYEHFDLETYFTNFIDYRFDDLKKTGLKRFLQEQQLLDNVEPTKTIN